MTINDEKTFFSKETLDFFINQFINQMLHIFNYTAPNKRRVFRFQSETQKSLLTLVLTRSSKLKSVLC